MVKDRTSSRYPSRADTEHPRDFPSRLAALIGTSSVRAFARKAGVSDTFLRQCLAGRTEPTRTKLIALAGAGGSTVEWLATGAGSRRPIEASGVDTAARADLDRPLLESIVGAVEEAVDELGYALSPKRKAILISALYESRSRDSRGAISRDEIRELVSRTA